MSLSKSSAGLIILSLTLLMLSACQKHPSYTTYDDCILANLTSSQTEAAVNLIRESCRSKFPLTPEEQAELDASYMSAEDAAQASADAAAAAADAAATAADSE